MQSYIIEGGRKIEGEIDVSGSKNAALPIMAATILNDGITNLYNVPNIHDIKVTIEILKYIGCKVTKDYNKLKIDSRNITVTKIPGNLMNKMRSSVIIAGAILRKIQNSDVLLPWWM